MNTSKNWLLVLILLCLVVSANALNDTFIRDAKNRNIAASVDVTSGGVVTQDGGHYEIHTGGTFSASYVDTDIDTDQTTYLIFQPLADGSIDNHLRETVSMNSDGYVALWEAPQSAITAGYALTITAYNVNRSGYGHTTATSKVFFPTPELIPRLLMPKYGQAIWALAAIKKLEERRAGMTRLLSMARTYIYSG